MNQEELKELIHFLAQRDIAEFSIERADTTVKIKRRVAEPGVVSLPEASSARTDLKVAESNSPVLAAAALTLEEEQLHIVKSPLVGTFHKFEPSASRPLVREGETIEAGRVVGLVEVLRIMHEIKSEVAGEIVRVVTGHREPVEYGQELLRIRPHH